MVLAYSIPDPSRLAVGQLVSTAATESPELSRPESDIVVSLRTRQRVLY